LKAAGDAVGTVATEPNGANVGAKVGPPRLAGLLGSGVVGVAGGAGGAAGAKDNGDAVVASNGATQSKQCIAATFVDGHATVQTMRYHRCLFTR
jgi:hypothetical protein